VACRHVKWLDASNQFISNWIGSLVAGLQTPLFLSALQMPFQYKRRDPKYIKAMIRKRRFDGEFEKALRDAHKRKPELLCNLLRSNDPLSKQHRVDLANLIEWHLQLRSVRGRPRGSILNSPRQQIEHQAILIAQQKLMQLRAKNGGRVRRGMHDKIIAEVIDLIGYLYEGEPGLNDVSPANIRSALKRGTKPKPIAR
jgi:hypothetical protein